MRTLRLTAIAVVILLGGFGCVPAVAPTPFPSPAPVPAPAPPTAAFGKETTVVVGRSATFEDGLAVELRSIGDSRCPAGVQCIWQGELSPKLILTGGTVGAQPRELTLGTVRSPNASLGGYAFTLTGATVDSATLIVAKAEAPQAQDDKIRVTAPLEGEVVTSPLVVRGEARGTWYFEAQFPVKLLDEEGRVIASTPAHATGDWMTEDFVPFTATLTFDRPSAVAGTLVLEKDNPSDLPQNADSRSIPIRFGTGVPAGGTTGISGKVTIGPTCPVERIPPDPACAPKPYAATLVIKSSGGVKVADVTTAADGTFSRSLPPGEYTVDSASTAAYPRLGERQFTVTAGAVTELDLMFDSGIR